ncbi:MAG: phage-related baseplate assembly protein [Phenylobacterium sp.]|jgi:phage-related baseplate assembly protein
MSISKIPLPDVLESLDYETILAERKARLITLAEAQYKSSGEEDKLQLLEQTLATESDPLVKLLQESAYRELLLRQRVNDAARAVMLPLAKGTDLDNLGSLFGAHRGTLLDGNNEGDEPYRERLLLAPKSLSTAGSKAAYKFHALSAGNQSDSITIESATDSALTVSFHYASQQNLVKDATIESPEPCVVNIYVLGFEQYGSIDADGIDKIGLYLSDDRVRPVGDRVTVTAADIVKYQLQLKLNLVPELEGSPQVELIIQHVRDQLVLFVSEHHFLGKAIRYSTLLGVISPLIDGWVELTMIKNGETLSEGADLLITSGQAAHLDLTGTDVDLTWPQRLAAQIEQSIEVTYDG